MSAPSSPHREREAVRHPRNPSVPFLALITLCVLAAPVLAAAPVGGGQRIFLEVPIVEGGVEEPGFDGWLEVVNYSASAADVGLPAPAPFLQVSCRLDRAFPFMTQLCARSTPLGQVRLVQSTPVSRLEVSAPAATCTGVLLVVADDGEPPVVTYTFDAAAVDWEFSQQTTFDEAGVAALGGFGPSGAFLTLRDVKGGSQTAGFDGAIQVESLVFSMSSAGPGNVSFSPWTVETTVDQSLPQLAAALFDGKQIVDGRFALQTPFGEAPVLEMGIGGIDVVNLGTNGQEGETSRQTVQLDYEKIFWTVRTFDQSGSVDGVFTTGWDVVTGQGI